MSQLFKTYGKDGHKTSAQTQLKSSVQRSIRNKISEQYPWLESNGVLETLLPKRADLTLIKLPEHVQLLVHDKQVMFFSTRDGGWFPTLRIVHQYPQCIPRLRADRGAIKFMLSGANMMCPGLTSPGATIHDEVEKGTPVALYGEDCEPALAVGYTTLSTQQIREQNKGIGVENLHYLTDGLWKNPKID